MNFSALQVLKLVCIWEGGGGEGGGKRGKGGEGGRVGSNNICKTNIAI